MKNLIYTTCLLMTVLFITSCEEAETEMETLASPTLSDIGTGEGIYQVSGAINERKTGTAIFEQTRDAELIEIGQRRDVWLITINAGNFNEFIEIVMPYDDGDTGPVDLLTTTYSIFPFGGPAPTYFYFQGIVGSSAFENQNLFMIQGWDDSSLLTIESVSSNEIQGSILVRDLDANGNELTYECVFKATPGSIFN